MALYDKNRVYKLEKEWVIIKDAHEPVVEMEDDMEQAVRYAYVGELTREVVEVEWDFDKR